MKISIAQIRPVKGNISANIESHLNFVDYAISSNSDAVFFPELSLTGYEPGLAGQLATHQNDERLNPFQQISDNNSIIIGLGLPTRSESKIRISMIIFQPKQPRQTYSKQELHTDELQYFENGFGQILIMKDNLNIAPAICYESLQPKHSENAFKIGADIYLASVAKSQNGVEKAIKHYPIIARQYSMPVLMTNGVGFCDNFLSCGKSSIWTKSGDLVGQLDDKTEGILTFDTASEKVIERTINY